MATLRDDIARLIEIHDSISNAGGISEEHLNQFQPELTRLKESIIEDLVRRPGLMVYIQDPVELQRAREAVDTLWDAISSDDIWDEVMSGGYGGLLAEVMGDFAERIQASRPTFVSVKPSALGFGSYVTEAYKCWLFGLNAAAVLICHSLLESALYEALGINDSVRSLAKEARRKGFITKNDLDFVRSLSDWRNRIVHNLDESPDSKLTNGILVWTKDIVERLLRSDAI